MTRSWISFDEFRFLSVGTNDNDFLQTALSFHRFIYGKKCIQHGCHTIRFLRTDLRFESGNEISQLSFGQTDIHADLKMRLKLTFNAVQTGKGRNGRNFTTLEVKVISSEDVAEKMLFQILIDGRCEVEKRSFDRRTGKERLDFRSQFKDGFIDRKRALVLCRFRR